jgi:hypothetical protein
MPRHVEVWNGRGLTEAGLRSTCDRAPVYWCPTGSPSPNREGLMSIRTPIRLAALAPLVCAATMLAACGSSSGGSPATGGGSPATGGGSTPAGGSTSQPATSGSSGSDAKCSDLTPAAASASMGKAVTVTLDTTGATLAGLTICNVTVADEGYPIQLDVDTVGGQALFSADEQAFGGKDLSGVGDKAFTGSTGVEVLSGGVDIRVIGPAGPVLSGNYTTAIGIAKAMVAAL